MPRISGGGMSFLIPGAAVVGTNQAGGIAASAFTLQHVELWASTAPTSASLIIDVNINGVTVFTTQANRPTITTGTKVGSRTVPDVQAIAAGDILTVDVDQVGSGTAGGAPLLISLVFL